MVSTIELNFARLTTLLYFGMVSILLDCSSAQQIKQNCAHEVMIDHYSYRHNLSSCEIKAWKKFRPEQDPV